VRPSLPLASHLGVWPPHSYHSSHTHLTHLTLTHTIIEEYVPHLPRNLETLLFLKRGSPFPLLRLPYPLLHLSRAIGECAQHTLPTRPPHSHFDSRLSPFNLTLFPLVNGIKLMEDRNILHESMQLSYSWYVGLLLAHMLPLLLLYPHPTHTLAISPHPKSYTPYLA
jgi:hypothetical protein